MVEKKNEDPTTPLFGNEAREEEEERHQPRWIQKYLDLADLLMRRRRQRIDDDKGA